MSSSSLVMHYPPLSPEENVAWLEQKLRCYADAWDLAQDLAAGVQHIVAVDTRSAAQYRAGHICGAISFPHREMTAETLAKLDRSKTYVAYCDGIGCNGSTRGALKLASAGLLVKELIGGLDFWRRDQHPVTEGDAPGEWPQALPATDCGC